MQAVRVAEGLAQSRGQRVAIAAGEDKAVFSRLDQIAPGAHAVADYSGAPAQHGLIYYYAKRLIFRRQHENVGGAINCRQLRLIPESQKVNALSNAKLMSASF